MNNFANLFDFIDGDVDNEQKTTDKTEKRKLTALKRISNEEVHKKNQKVYETYRVNEQKSLFLRGEILKGIKQGKPIELLMIKSLQAIGLMTNDTAFMDQAIKDIKIIYGQGLNNDILLLEELTETNNRLIKLKKEYIKETDSFVKNRLSTAIKKHEGKIIEIEGKITENGRQNQ